MLNTWKYLKEKSEQMLANEDCLLQLHHDPSLRREWTGIVAVSNIKKKKKKDKLNLGKRGRKSLAWGVAEGFYFLRDIT